MEINQILKWYYGLQESKKFSLIEKNSAFKCHIKLSKDDSGLFFELAYPHNKLIYNNDSRFLISDDFFELNISHYTTHHTQSLLTRKLNAYIFNSCGHDKFRNLYHKYVSKIDSTFLINFYEEFVEQIIVQTPSGEYTIKIINFDRKNFLQIENSEATDFKTFNQVINTIITSIGFITGYYFKKEELYFQSCYHDFTENIEILCIIGNNKLTILEPITNSPTSYCDTLEDVLIERNKSFINNDIFNSLVNLLIDKPKIYSAFVSMFQIYKVYPLSRLSMLFVILETICEEFNKELVTDNVTKITLATRGNQILDSIKNSISVENFSELKDIISNVDRKFSENTISYERCFKGLEIGLSNIEKKVFKKLNKIFHGNIIPSAFDTFYEDDIYKLDLEYDYYSLVIYGAISKLILKKVGFSGYVINHFKVEESKLKQEKTDNPLFKKI